MLPIDFSPKLMYSLYIDVTVVSMILTKQTLELIVALETTVMRDALV